MNVVSPSARGGGQSIENENLPIVVFRNDNQADRIFIVYNRSTHTPVLIVVTSWSSKFIYRIRLQN